MKNIKNKDLSFDIKTQDGEEMTCDILSVVPNEENKNEPYIVFTDYLLDENDEFILHFGKIMERDGEYQLLGIEDIKTIQRIKEQLSDEIVSRVNKQFQDFLDE
ncbi:MAG: hypothetical protein IJI60_02475 [Bacilli bacterium]|nr:hypothetical protein [Bacilli bacterium]